MNANGNVGNPDPDQLEVIDLSSDSEDEGHGPMGGVPVVGNAAANAVGPIAEEEIPMFTKEISRAQASGRQPLPIPFAFTKAFLNRDWDVLLVHSPDGPNYDCKLLWSKKKARECFLGGEWYNFVKDMNICEGDTVQFEAILNGINYVHAYIVRGLRQ